MKLAFYCSNRTVFPPPEGIVAANADVMKDIIEGMVKRGHQITVYASKGSYLKGVEIIDLDLESHNTDPAFEKDPISSDIHAAYRMHYISKLIENSEKYDLIHLHVGRIVYGLPFVKFSKVPVLFTMHEQLPEPFLNILNQYNNQNVVAISNQQASFIPKNLLLKTIHHGINFEKIPFGKNGGENFIYLGRLSPEKGIENLLEIARSSEINLDLYGPVEKLYFINKIKPYLNKKIRYQGMAPKYSIKWHKAFLHAKALLLPLKWDEPFGLVMIEAMAHGTPVIAYNRGSVSEIILNNKTGFIVESNQEISFLEAIRKIQSYGEQTYKKVRQNCRLHIQANFSLSKMIDEYEKVYLNLKERKNLL